MIDELKQMMMTAMVDFMTKAKNAVVNIVFFRDGVSEGEYERIRDAEIGAINGNSHLRNHSITALTSTQRPLMSCGPRGKSLRKLRRKVNLSPSRS